MRIRTVAVEPCTLSPDATERLIDELYAVQRQVFDGVERDTFGDYVVRSKADQTWIDVQRLPDGRAVGYLATHIYLRKVGGRSSVILRAEAGTLRAFRGQTNVVGHFIRRALPLILGSALRPFYYLGAFVHPSSYRAFTRFARTIWPTPDRDVPPEILATMSELADSFGLRRVHDSQPLVRQVGWITRDAEAERLWWAACELPDVAYFIRTNPGYHRGHGLVTLVPGTMMDMLVGVSRFLRGRLSGRLEGLRASVQRLPGFEAEASAEEISSALARLDGVLPEDVSVLTELLKTSMVMLVPRGQVIFRRYDRPDAMYIVLSGSASVLLEDSRGREVLLGQLGVGQLVGEFGLLSGEPRSASVRASSRLRLLRIDREEVRLIARDVPEVYDALWRSFGLRLFLTHIQQVPSLVSLGLAKATALFRSATRVRVHPDQRLVMEAGLIFLEMGMAEFDMEDARVSLRGPALLELRSTTVVRGHGEARIMRLDSSQFPAWTSSDTQALRRPETEQGV